MNKLSALILPTDIRNFPANETLYNNLYTKVFLIIGMPITIGFTIFHLIYSRYLAAGFVFVMFLSLCILLFDFIKKSGICMPNLFQKVSIRVFIIFFIFSQMYDVWIEQTLSSIPWFLLFPLLIFFSLNIKEALIWSFCISVILFYSLFIIDLGSNPDEIFNLKVRLIILFGTLAIIALIISGIIRSALQMLFDNAKVMKTINLRLKKEIEEHKQSEETLRNNEEKFRLLTENANDVIWILDMGLNYNYISPAIEKIQGWSSEEAVLLKINDVLTPLSLEIAHKKIEANLVYGSKTGDYDISERLELELYRKDGNTIWTEISASFILDEDGKPIGILGVTRDITERKNLEGQLFQAQKMEAIGVLAGGIAHDFNNLLMGIQGRTSLIALDMTHSNPQLFEHIEAIRKTIDSAADLTKQLLGYARGGKYDVQPVDINKLLLTTATMFGRTRKELRIRTKTDPTQPVAEADKSQIEQLFMNLFVNAWQAMPGGGDLSLETAVVDFDDEASRQRGIDPRCYIKIMVTDTGIGMDEGIQKKIFDPFFTTKDKSRGTGMGLASVYGIIKNHGGMISVKSAIGRGTTFEIYLPASEKRAIKEISFDEEMMHGSETILLIDDEEMILDVTKELISELGYQVLVVNSGEEAVRTITNPTKGIDLVILDLIMPGMDGGQTFDRIREIRPQIPVMLCSGYALDGDATEIMSRGCNGFIQKPYNHSELSKKIRKILDAV